MSAFLILAGPLLLPTALFQTQPTTTAPTTVSEPVVQETFATTNWLDGKRASLKGGQYTTSQDQFNYAERKNLVAMNFQRMRAKVSAGELVKLEGRFITYKSSRTIRYVLPSTKRFVQELAIAYNGAGCGSIVITDALRIRGYNIPRNASSHSVHPMGMAVDIRVNGLPARCERWLNDYFTQREARAEVDVTREHRPAHFHIVVPLEQ